MNNELREKINKLINDTKAKNIGTKVLYKGNFITLILEEYLLPNGIKMPRERIIKNNNKPAVLVVAKTELDQYILVVQNRINNIISVEFPAGYIEPGETVVEAAARELLEETGYSSSDIEILDSFSTALGIDGSMVHIAVANNCIKTSDQKLDENEYINYGLFSLDEIEELINNHYINGAGNRLAYYEIINKKNKIKVLK